MNSNKSVLVTGGAGFIGSHIAENLLKEGYKVVVLDDLSGGFSDNVPEGAIFVEGSINDVVLVEKLFNEYKFYYVYHLAAYAAEGLSHFIRKFNYENNLIGSINLINQSVIHDVKCFVFTSSIAVYGKNQLPMSESMIPQPEDPYGVAKYAVEMDLKCAHEMFGLNYIIFRPHNVYGERQNIGDRYRNVIGIFINRLIQKMKLPIFGDGEQQRAFTYISDVAPIISKSVENERAYGQVFNIGADTPYTVNQLAKYVSEAMGVNPDIEYLEERNEVKFAYADHSKLMEHFPEYKSSVDLKEGIVKMVEWAGEYGAQKSKNFDNIEILKNLPNSWKN
jgi:UDP-glucose 4-epimerase